MKRYSSKRGAKRGKRAKKGYRKVNKTYYISRGGIRL